MKFIIMKLLILLLLLFLIIYRSNNYFEWNKCNIQNQTKLTDTFNKYGLIIIPELLNSNETNNLLNIVLNKEKNFHESENFEIRSFYKRKNITIPFNDCKKYIVKIYKQNKYFIDKLTPNAKIVECAALITEPGCYPQGWHTDTYLDKINPDKYANLISFGIALDDIDETLGPLEGILKTNNLKTNEIDNILNNNNLLNKYDENYYHKDCIYIENDIKRGLCNSALFEITKLNKNFKHVKTTCKKGSLIIWSSKVFHRGGQNYGYKNRPIFYFTLVGDNGENPMHYSINMDNNKEIFIKSLI